MNYITERRGGYDEWSDEYESILGIQLGDGKEVRGRKITEFTDKKGNDLDIELPMRRGIGETITIERYTPSYEYLQVPSLSVLSNHTDLEKRCIDITALQKEL